MIRKFKDFKKSIAVYHGLGGNVNYERVDVLKSIGFDIIHYPHIDYESEWDKDRLRGLFLNEIDAYPITNIK
jgi:hypothetical protein